MADKEVLELDSTEQLIFENLRKVRLRIAVAKGLPTFTICHDSILREMAKKKPDTPETLLSIHGVGKKFIENYSEFFIDEIKKKFTESQGFNKECI